MAHIFEPWHDKINKVSLCPAKTQISLGICPVWLVFAVHMKKPWVLSYPLSALRRLWSDWADAQADPSLRWAHSHIVGFVMSRLILGWNALMTAWYCNDPKFAMLSSSFRHISVCSNFRTITVKNSNKTRLNKHPFCVGVNKWLYQKHVSVSMKSMSIKRPVVILEKPLHFCRGGGGGGAGFSMI